MKQKMIGVVAVLALALVLSGGVAMAKFIPCAGGSCVGTEFALTIPGPTPPWSPTPSAGLGARDEDRDQRGQRLRRRGGW